MKLKYGWYFTTGAYVLSLRKVLVCKRVVLRCPKIEEHRNVWRKQVREKDPQEPFQMGSLLTKFAKQTATFVQQAKVIRLYTPQDTEGDE